MRGLRCLSALLLGLHTLPAGAESLVAARNLPAQHLIMPGDIALSPDISDGALSDPLLALGLETRVAIYAGRPLRSADLGPPALIERNASVALEYRAGALVIRAEGRALGRAGAGEMVRVMNLSSKATVSGLVGRDGLIHIGALP
ncbi:flagellar basal body P-ring formation chaperone FlgA [Pseudogemmobacter faecipullorum]|uniref:Flagella basal body P-ring formation protein FlgA n=1 Tax=Pseudogemmobacter faecipullorum TaxID=2755041 RepID=A0ABS8CJM1_9RHOB|nr:flagellar basal body P-ring formation chaperone FlgA [Pseudogemmobacter faecipullorum]MCB5409570.1 flagellar basal body P-ring formation protein FlgA [Pseudogemmobacter faecipullorum]